MPACYSRNLLFLFSSLFVPDWQIFAVLFFQLVSATPENSRMFVPGYPVNYCFLAFSTHRHWRGFGTPGEEAANRTLPLTPPLFFLPSCRTVYAYLSAPNCNSDGSSRFDCGPARESAPNRWPYVPEAPISFGQLMNCS